MEEKWLNLALKYKWILSKSQQVDQYEQDKIVGNNQVTCICMCWCVCVCVCERNNERQRKTEREVQGRRGIFKWKKNRTSKIKI